MAQELINYGRKCGPIPSSTTDFKSIQHINCKTAVPPVRVQKAMSSPGQGGQANTGENTRKKKYLVECGMANPLDICI